MEANLQGDYPKVTAQREEGSSGNSWWGVGGAPPPPRGGWVLGGIPGGGGPPPPPRVLQILTLSQTKKCHFHTRFQTWSLRN